MHHRARALLVPLSTMLFLLATAAPAAAAQTSSNRQQPGPYDIALFNTPKASDAKGKARLVSAESPFGIAVTADGRARYDVRIDVAGLPRPSTLGPY
jgi:hypothetical protein